ncbi:DUF4143 domain-containing protein [Candidatus Poriferisodalis sp.]|uniref:DUF4143 domain-containing protein n=1 Tax=Candidatus Poriferisodalis sp. TaxID=3101277 RepID=UPI003D0CB02B
MAPTSLAASLLLETFVVNEIARSLSASSVAPRLHHYRDHQRHEVDLVLERSDGAVAAFEIKATTSPSVSQLRHVEWLRDRINAAAPGAFRAGILLHTGDQRYTVGDRLHICPIDTLWA